MSSKIPGLPTEQPPEVDLDEEGSPMNPEEGVLRSPMTKKPAGFQTSQSWQPAQPLRSEAARCEDVFCETKTVEESTLMDMSPEKREQHLKGPASGR